MSRISDPKRSENKSSMSRGRSPIKKTSSSPTRMRGSSPQPTGQIPDSWHLDGDISNDPIACSIMTRINHGVLVASVQAPTLKNKGH